MLTRPLAVALATLLSARSISSARGFNPLGIRAVF